MAKYLDTSQISSELMQLLKEAKEKIILVTYSLQVNSQIQERLKTKSKIGTLSEITIIYGNTPLKNSELKWMEEIEDLKIFQKKNLHAKCYLNENKAIISSMNLYDYSQTTNIEMGFLITKEENPEAFEQMLNDIADMKINGERKKINQIEESENEKSKVFSQENKNEILTNTSPIEIQSKLSYQQQVKKYLLESFRQTLSFDFKQNSKIILPDDIINQIISKDELNISVLNKILNSEKKTKQIGDDIIRQLYNYERYTIGKILEVRYENNDLNYDQVRMERLDNKIISWYDTKRELPKKGQFVAVELNGNWFNDYIILEETSKNTVLQTTNIAKDYSKSKYLSTNEMSKLTGLSSQNINSFLNNIDLMYKKDNDWIPTAKGMKYGAIQKEGQFGKFIIWPEEIINEFGIK